MQGTALQPRRAGDERTRKLIDAVGQPYSLIYSGDGLWFIVIMIYDLIMSIIN